MTSAPLTVALSQHEEDRPERAEPHLLDLNLTALEQQFFVDWEVPEPEPPSAR